MFSVKKKEKLKQKSWGTLSSISLSLIFERTILGVQCKNSMKWSKATNSYNYKAVLPDLWLKKEKRLFSRYHAPEVFSWFRFLINFHLIITKIYGLGGLGHPLEKSSFLVRPEGPCIFQSPNQVYSLDIQLTLSNSTFFCYSKNLWELA